MLCFYVFSPIPSPIGFQFAKPKEKRGLGLACNERKGAKETLAGRKIERGSLEGRKRVPTWRGRMPRVLPGFLHTSLAQIRVAQPFFT